MGPCLSPDVELCPVAEGEMAATVDCRLTFRFVPSVSVQVTVMVMSLKFGLIALHELVVLGAELLLQK